MAELTLRLVKGAPLTNAELDANFSNLNADVAARLLASSNLADLNNAGTARINLGLGNVEDKSSATILSELTLSNVTTALGFTPQEALVSGTSIKTVNGQSVLGSGNIQIDGGVTSFNSRTGAVTLDYNDVVDALGYAPYFAVPGDIVLTDQSIGTYAVALPSNNGTASTGSLLFKGASGPSWSGVLQYDDANLSLTGSGLMNFSAAGLVISASPQQLAFFGNTVLHSGNYSSYALPLSGGTLTGNTGIGGAPNVNARLRVVGSGASSEVARIEGGTLASLLLINQTDDPGVNSNRSGISFRKNNVEGGAISVDYNGTRGIVYYDAAGSSGSHAFYINGSDRLRLNQYGGLSFSGAGYGTAGQFLKSGGGTAAAAWGALTSSEVTTALGYTPYNSTNPNGYITSSALSSYLPLSGGTMTGDLGVNGSVSATSFKAGPLDPTAAYPSASVVTDSISLAQKFLAQNTVVSASLASIPTSGANYTGSPAQTYIAGNSYTSFAINGMSAGDLAKLSATQVGTSFSFMYTDGWYGSYTENRTVASVSTVGTTVTITFTQSWIPAIDVSSSNLILPYTFTYSVPATAVTLNNATTGWITGKGTVYFTSNGTTVSVPVSDITGIGTSTITITGSYPAIAAGQSFGYLSASAMSLNARGGDGLNYTGLKFNWSTTSAMNYWGINGVRLNQKGLSVLIGTYAGYNLTTQNGNTFIGDSAGQSITTGSSNTIVGNFGGIFSVLDITTSNGYVVLANGAGTPYGIWGPNRVQQEYQPTPTAKTTTATLTAAEVATRIITCATGTYTITLPTGSTLDGGWQMPADYSIDITFIATGTGTITIAGNTGVTIVGLATLTNTQSAQFRLRKTAAATYVAYRIS